MLCRKTISVFTYYVQGLPIFYFELVAKPLVKLETWYYSFIWPCSLSSLASISLTVRKIIKTFSFKKASSISKPKNFWTYVYMNFYIKKKIFCKITRANTEEDDNPPFLSAASQKSVSFVYKRHKHTYKNYPNFYDVLTVQVIKLLT